MSRIDTASLSWSRPVPVAELPAALFRMPVRIYYEDTDAGGIVYHANYLRFFERARTDWMRQLGVVHSDMLARDSIGFVVRDLVLDYLAPARLDDGLIVDVRLLEAKRATMRLAQVATHEATGRVLVTALMRIAAIDPATGKPVGFPAWLMEKIAR